LRLIVGVPTSPDPETARVTVSIGPVVAAVNENEYVTLVAQTRLLETAQLMFVGVPALVTPTAPARTSGRAGAS
jgi:hypothetical protein